MRTQEGTSPRAGHRPRRDWSLLDRLPEAVVIVGPDGIVRAHNDRVHGLLGVRDATGRPLREVVHVEDEAIAGDHLLELPAPADRLAEHLVHVRLPDGRVRPVTVTGRRDGDELVLTFRGAARRERLDTARSELVATVSHEIRSPLTSVKGFTRTLLAKWDRFSDDQKRTMLETINADADRVTRLLTELLDVSRIDAGRVRLQPERIELGEVVERVLERVRLRPDAQQRDIATDLDDLQPVLADPDKIEQIVTNLVENALTHAPDSPVRITARPSEPGVRLTVADRGPGLSEEQQRRIFRKFGRGGDHRTGTGLGLYITRGLIEAHGGRVWCESSPGQGARFHVELPPLGPHGSDD